MPRSGANLQRSSECSASSMPRTRALSSRRATVGRKRLAVTAIGQQGQVGRALPALALHDQSQSEDRMDEDKFNMSLRKFLKQVGVTSQREIERVVREGKAKSGKLEGENGAHRCRHKPQPRGRGGDRSGLMPACDCWYQSRAPVRSASKRSMKSAMALTSSSANTGNGRLLDRMVRSYRDEAASPSASGIAGWRRPGAALDLGDRRPPCSPRR